jgi:hypothetical protein
MNTKEAMAVVTGKKTSVSVEHFYDCYQWLYDNNVELDLPEECMLDKLICDGVIVTEDNPVSHRGISAMAAVQLGDSE